ncbi:uncharacterized protein V3H86_013288 [Mergus octosetaceus]
MAAPGFAPPPPSVTSAPPPPAKMAAAPRFRPLPGPGRRFRAQRRWRRRRSAGRGGAAAAADGGGAAGPGAVGGEAEGGVPGAHPVRGEQQERRQRLVPPRVQRRGHPVGDWGGGQLRDPYPHCVYLGMASPAQGAGAA